MTLDLLVRRGRATAGLALAALACPPAAALAATAGDLDPSCRREFGGALRVRDTMTTTAEFVGAGGAALGRRPRRSPSRSAATRTTLLRRESRAPMPAGARRIRVELRSEAIGGGVSLAPTRNVNR